MAKKLTDEEREERNARRRAKAAEKKIDPDCTTCKDPKTGKTKVYNVTRTCWLPITGRNHLKLIRGTEHQTEDEKEIEALENAGFSVK